MVVCEIFSSIQGESTWQGFPFSFVRLSDCNLRCGYCDTRYAYTEGRKMEVEEIVAEVTKLGLLRVLVTGGEPLLQQETPLLLDRLSENMDTVLLETNGSIPLHEITHRCIKIVDVKTPGSGEEGSFLDENISCLAMHDEVKFVITSRNDFIFSKKFIKSKLHAFPGTLLLSPAHPDLEAGELARWVLEEKLDCRINLQLHRYIFPGKERGI